jgi:hypothetical protein
MSGRSSEDKIYATFIDNNSASLKNRMGLNVMF